MGDKSLQKRKYILERARSVFYKNGYRAVTMKDIVDACGISRGVLYLNFSSTKELF
ncbi:MAG: TetR/AcrR family transcriptional regulator [Lachnospiraceae bacterium]|nr:TetR/AcrR family transcriptional regulator [Lachnospiraceae bacterium]